MFTISNEYGSIPYDGFTMYSRRFPRREFNVWARQQTSFTWRDPHKNKKGWENSISLRVNGAAGALKVMWRPLITGRNMPMTAIYVNPSTAGLSPNATLALIRWVLMWPEEEPVGVLATKLDFVDKHKEIDARIYYPKLKEKKPNQKFEGTNYHGSVTGRVRPKVYDKGRESGEEPCKVARFEIIEKLTNNSAKGLRRPSLVELLQGNRVEQNAMSHAMVVDLAAVEDPILTERALQDGLTEALRDGHLPKNGPRGANMGWLRRRVNDNADKQLLFLLYQEQAMAWHSQFDLLSVDNLAVMWSDELGVVIVPGATATTLALGD